MFPRRRTFRNGCAGERRPWNREPRLPRKLQGLRSPLCERTDEQHRPERARAQRGEWSLLDARNAWRGAVCVAKRLPSTLRDRFCFGPRQACRAFFARSLAPPPHLRCGGGSGRPGLVCHAFCSHRDSVNDNSCRFSCLMLAFLGQGAIDGSGHLPCHHQSKPWQARRCKQIISCH